MAEKEFMQWYRSKAADLANEAPEGVWNSIENELDINEVWNNVEDELDVTEVWGRLCHQLDVRQPVRWQKPVSYALILALLILTVIPFRPDTGLVAVSSHVISDKVVDCSTSENVDKGAANAAPAATTETLQRGPANTSADNKIKSGKIGVRSTNLVVAEEQAQAVQDQRGKMKDAAFKPHNEISQNPLVSDPVFALERKSDLIASDSATVTTEDPVKKNERRFYAGVQGEVKNKWLLSHKTFYNLEKQSVNTTEITYGKEFGASFGYFVRPRLALQLSLNYSQEGQRYHEYIDGRYLRTEIDLRYLEFSLASRLIQRKFSSVPNSSTSITGGIYYGILLGSYNNIGTNTFPLTGYKHHNLGITGAIEHELKLTRHLHAAGGLHFKYGLTNIFEGNTTAPALFNQTNTASAGLTISLRHYFQR